MLKRRAGCVQLDARRDASPLQPQPPFHRASIVPPSLFTRSHLNDANTAMETIDISRLKSGEVNLGVRRLWFASRANLTGNLRRPQSWRSNSRTVW